MHRERADYLVALTRNRVGEWNAARKAAQSGLETIAANGSEDVDKAFLHLEVARAALGAMDPIGHAAAMESARALAAQFKEPGLDEWFASRAKGL